jgi:hypothetical protein
MTAVEILIGIVAFIVGAFVGAFLFIWLLYIGSKSE